MSTEHQLPHKEKANPAISQIVSVIKFRIPFLLLPRCIKLVVFDSLNLINKGNLTAIANLLKALYPFRLILFYIDRIANKQSIYTLQRRYF